MTYVRWLISECRDGQGAVRRYEVETPRWFQEADDFFGVCFPRLVELELRLTQECADYYRKVPYSLAETVWTTGLSSLCGTLFCSCCCCWEDGVLYYPRELDVEPITEFDKVHRKPVILTVGLRPRDRELRPVGR